MCGGFVAFAASVLLRDAAGPNLLFDAGLYNLPFAASALLCLTRRGAERLAWQLLGVGLAIFTVANLYSTIWLGRFDEPPYPSLGDAGWLIFYAFAYACLATLTRRWVHGSSVHSWLDGLVAALGGVSVASALALGPILETTTGPLTTVATNLAYPTGDLMLLLFVIALGTVAGQGLGARILLVGGAFAFFAVTDTIFLFRTAAGTYVEGGVLDLGWAGAAMLMGLAALTAPARSRVRRPESMVWLPLTFSLAAVVVLAAQGFAEVPIPAVAFAAATLGLAVVRVLLAFRELHGLATARLLARTDDLTELTNRRGFYELLEELVERGAGDVSVLLIDLDRFKEVNDSLGHQAGDRLLVQVGSRLSAELDAGAVALARLGGDEFAVLTTRDHSHAQAVADRMHDALAAPFDLDGLTVHARASIGIARFPEHAANTDELLARADVAMYAAKRAGSGVEVFHPERDRESQHRLLLIEALRGALGTPEVLLHYQPIVRLADDGIHALEALVRWQHPTRGLLSPGVFLPLASANGLMGMLTKAVFADVARQAAAWREDGLEVPVAVNLSADVLHDPALPETVLATLEAHGLSSNGFIIEVTEDALMVDFERCVDALAELRRLGFRVSIDDYGIGRSSLAYLRDLPVDELKLDRTFTQGLSDKRSLAIVRSTIMLAHELELPVIAEGIESAETFAQLTALGCDAVQGFHISPAIPAADATGWLRGWAATRAA